MSGPPVPKLKDFIAALNDDDQEKWKAMIKVEGFVTKENFIAWSQSVVERWRVPRGRFTWHLISALIDHVGTDASVWNPPDELRSGTGTWAGFASVGNDNYRTVNTYDPMAHSFLKNRLSDDCFDIVEIVFTASMPKRYMNYTDGDWDEYIRETGISRDKTHALDSMDGRVELTTTIHTHVVDILNDHDRILAMAERIRFSEINFYPLQFFVKKCPTEVLHAGYDRSILARVVSSVPTACRFALRTRPELLEGYEVSMLPEPFLNFFMASSPDNSDYKWFRLIICAADRASRRILLENVMSRGILRNNVIVSDEEWNERVAFLSELVHGSTKNACV